MRCRPLIREMTGNGSKIAFKKFVFRRNSPKRIFGTLRGYDVTWWRHRAKIKIFHKITIYKLSFEHKVDFFENCFFLKCPKIWGSKIFHARIWGHFGIKLPKCKPWIYFWFLWFFSDFFEFFWKKKSIFGPFDPLFDPLLGKPYGKTPQNKIFQVKKKFFAKFRQNR